jgi:hypothetical protein
MGRALSVATIVVLAACAWLLLGDLRQANAAPGLNLPWPYGQQHRISGGYTYGCASGTHNTATAGNSTVYNADLYAIDFQFTLNEIVAAASGGTASVFPDNGDGYGNKVVVDHTGGYYSVYAHLNGFAISHGAVVQGGTPVGYAGGSGGYPVHLHFHMQSDLSAYEPEPMSGVTGFDAYGIPWNCADHGASPYWTSSPPYGTDTIGWWRGGDQSWHLSNDFNSSSEYACVYGSASTNKPVTGDWDSDGDDTIGWWRGSDKSWHLTNGPCQGTITSQYICVYGSASTDIPVRGDWDGDGDDTIGWWRPGDKSWHLTNGPCSGTITSNYTCVYGSAATDIPVVGDWDGDGDDTIGWFRPGDSSWHLTNGPCQGTITSHYTCVYADTASDKPVNGDWDGDGDTTIGWWRGGDRSWHLTNGPCGDPVSSDEAFVNGESSTNIPVTGDWDGE